MGFCEPLTRQYCGGVGLRRLVKSQHERAAAWMGTAFALYASAMQRRNLQLEESFRRSIAPA